MKAEAILKKIEENAKDLSSELLNEAKQKAEQLQQDSNRKVEQMRQDLQKQIEAEATQMRKQMESIGELEFKKQILVEKRNLMNEAFALAKSKLRNLPITTIREKVCASIIENAPSGASLHIGEIAKEWFTEEVFAQINAALQAKGKKALCLGETTVKDCTGAILVKDGIEINCSLETVLEYLKSDLENDVATKLFGA